MVIAQQLFGLKYREAMTLRRSMLLYDNVRILRKYAFNRKYRFIPIERDQQKTWVAAFQDWEQMLKNIPNQKLIKRIQKNYQSIASPNLEYFRYQYARNRYCALCNTTTKHDVERHAMQKLRSELGLCDNRQLKLMLSCLK